MNNPIAFTATSNPDTLYYHEALQAPDRDNFIQAMQKEVQDHEDREHWELIPQSKVPEGTIILPAVWSMKHKHCIKTNSIYK